MSFLSAAFLFALPLIAVPVVIHLYRGRQRDVIPWGAMQFLASAATKGRRLERLEELLLMCLRLTAVAALVLALARPMIRSSWFGDSAEEQLIVVLDNSLSMSRQVAGQTASDVMKDRAAKAIDGLSSSVGVQVLLTVGNEWVTAEDVAADGPGKQRLFEFVDAANPTTGTSHVLESLQAAVHIEGPESLTRRRIVVFTDNQEHAWQSSTSAEWRQLASDIDAARIPTLIEVVACSLSPQGFENIAVTKVQAAKPLVRPDESLKVAAEITNYGESPVDGLSVEWLVAGKVTGRSSTPSLAPGASARVATTVRLPTAGVTEIRCRLEHDDQTSLDQESSVVVEVADQLPVLLVQSENDVAARIPTEDLFATALGFGHEAPLDWHSKYRPDTIPPTALANHELSGYRVIVINNPAELDHDTLDRLRSFVQVGGGVWLALGDQAEREAFNRDWYGDGDGLSPVALDELVILGAEAGAAATIHPPSPDHVATAHLANTTQLDIDEARLDQQWLFAKPGEETAAAPLLESGEGRILVAERYLERGRVIVQAFPLGLEWSNLPLLKAYVVMVHDWLDYLTAPTASRYNLAAGESIVLAAPASQHGGSAEIVTPRGRIATLSAVDEGFSHVFRHSQTRLPGTYRVRLGGGSGQAAEYPFHIAREADESNLRTLCEADLSELASVAGLQFGETAPKTSLAATPAPRSEPLWGVLLAALVALLVAELVMASIVARRRFGDAAVPMM